MIGYIELVKDELPKEAFNGYCSFKNANVKDGSVVFYTVSSQYFDDIPKDIDKGKAKKIRKEVQAIRNLLKVTENETVKEILRDRLVILKEIKEILWFYNRQS